jgi:hypothetical protein
MIRLVQISHPTFGKHVACVDEPRLRIVPGFATAYELASDAIKRGKRIAEIVRESAPTDSVEYEPVYKGLSAWTLLPPFHHPVDPAHCFVTGTGLTHKKSAENRQSMHGDPWELTDSMKMYRVGLEGGRPDPGCIGASPEWFYKGTGTILRGQNQPLVVPSHGEDGGEEAEIAGVYLVGPEGAVFRVGFVQGNEFSDHVMEARNYLYLAQSKLRCCAIGPELIVNGEFNDVRGKAWIEREGRLIWIGPLSSGERYMCHSLANMEHHHFKHSEHRRPGDVHVHFFGADLFSFKDRVRMQDDDVMVVTFENFGRALRNPIKFDKVEQKVVGVKPL